jgi:hypothetical protein
MVYGARNMIILKRNSFTELGTFGVLFDVASRGMFPIAVTLEPPWYDNQDDISCIPAGQYSCKRIQSPRFGEVFEVQNVVNRSHILFHKGNTRADTHGCILVAEGVRYREIINSRNGFDFFMSVLKDQNEFLLQIDNP